VEASKLGRDAYQPVLQLAMDETVKLETRAKAIKCLAQHSKQHFDRNLPSDPGHWKKEDLRISELRTWSSERFAPGEEYHEPLTDPRLAIPVTAFDKVAAKLEKKLAKQRKERQDPASPTDWLVPARDEDIEKITARWNLPERYLYFLTHFSPLNVYLKGRRFVNGLTLYGASSLIEMQGGYSINTITNEVIKEWPESYVVIADDGGDPFCFDLTKSDGVDAPVYTSMHGAGILKFKKYTGSFTQFLEKISS